MPEAPPKRTSPMINQESANLQLQAGGAQYIIRQKQKELDMLNDRLLDLAIEFHAVKKQEDAEAKLRAEIEAKVRAEEVKPVEEKPKLEIVKDQNPSSEVKQASTQSGSEAAPKPSQPSPDEQSQKKE